MKKKKKKILCPTLLYIVVVVEPVLISSHEFSHFYTSDCLPHPTRREGMSSCMGLSYWLGLNHDNIEGQVNNKGLPRTDDSY